MQQTVGGEAEALHALYLAVSQFAQEFDPNALSGADAKRILEDAGRTESVLGVIKALSLVRIDETNAYRSAGYKSAADYGAAKTGTTRSDAQRSIKTAKRVRHLPNTDEAMRKGDISPQQADAIAHAASVNPDAEDDLLRSAKHDDVGTLKRKAKQAKFSADRDADARHRRIHAQRSFRHWTDEEGAFHAHLKTTPEAGARLLAALKPLQRDAFDHARKEERREAPEAYAADALDALARGGAQPEPAPVGEPTDTDTDRSGWGRAPSDHPGRSGQQREAALDPSQNSSAPDHARTQPTTRGPSPRARSEPRAVVFLNVDQAALERGHLEPGDICEIPGVGPVSLATARALLGDATVELIIKKGVDVVSVVHLGRTVTPAQRRALEARDPCCIVPGCGRTHGLEIDHKTGWAINRITTLNDLARLCQYHHMLKTLYGYTYTGGPGTWQWIAPPTFDQDLAEAS